MGENFVADAAEVDDGDTGRNGPCGCVRRAACAGVSGWRVGSAGAVDSAGDERADGLRDQVFPANPARGGKYDAKNVVDEYLGRAV